MLIELHNIGLEQAVLTTLMSVPDAYDYVSSDLHIGLMYAGRHQLILSAIVALKAAQSEGDAVMVRDWLDARRKLADAGGESYLSEMLTSTLVTTGNLKAHISRLQDLSTRRNAQAALQRASDLIANSPDIPSATLVNDAVEALLSAGHASSGDEGLVDMGCAADEFLEDMEKIGEQAGVSTGFIDLDAKTGGFEAGDLIILGARPSMGKTAIAMNMVDFIARTEDAQVLVFSLEMRRIQMTRRIIAANASVNVGNLRSRSLDAAEWQRLTPATLQLKKTPIYIDDTAGRTIGDIRTQTNKAARERGRIAAIMIDYLQIMGGLGVDNRIIQIGEVTRALKQLGKEHNCPVILLSQLNRSLESRPNKRPLMSDLRESGSIEQDADIIMFLYRDEYYDKQSKAIGMAELIIGKCRNGPTGTVPLRFRGEYSRFENAIGQDLNIEDMTND